MADTRTCFLAKWHKIGTIDVASEKGVAGDSHQSFFAQTALSEKNLGSTPISLEQSGTRFHVERHCKYCGQKTFGAWTQAIVPSSGAHFLVNASAFE